MPWKRNKSALAHEYPSLEFLPSGRTSWDCTLACLAYGIGLALPGRKPDLSLWATAHGLPASGAHTDAGEHAMVLWHGTSHFPRDVVNALAALPVARFALGLLRPHGLQQLNSAQAPSLRIADLDHGAGAQIDDFVFDALMVTLFVVVGGILIDRLS